MKKTFPPILLLVCFWCGISAGRAQSGTMTFQYYGYVDSSSANPLVLGNNELTISIGDRVDATATVWTTTPASGDSNPDPTIGEYSLDNFDPGPTRFPFAATISVANNTNDTGQFSGEGDPLGIINSPSGDSVTVGHEAYGFPVETNWINMYFSDPSGNALSSDAWTTLYSPNSWPSIRWDVVMNDYETNTQYVFAGRVPAVQTENLSIQAKSPVSSGVFSEVTLSGGKGSFFSATAANQFVTYAMPVAVAGNYIVRVGVQTKPKKGKFQLNISGIKVGPVQDEYSSAIGHGFRDLGTAAFFAAGMQPFQFTVTGRNPSSGGYSLDFDYIDLFPTNRRESESLKVQTLTPPPKGTPSAQWYGAFYDTTGASDGGGSYFNAKAPAQFVTYSVPVITPGTYHVYVGVQTKADKGQFQLLINGAKVGKLQDEYASSLGYNQRDLGTFTFPSSGNYQFQFKVKGKNTSSTGYTLAFDYIDLVPVN